jgi:hypothetical protein
MDPSEPLFGDSPCNVVVEDIVSSLSELFDGVGEVARSGEVLRFLDRIFCVIRVCENGLACVDNGLEYSSTVVLMADVISSREVYGKQILRMQLDPNVSMLSLL